MRILATLALVLALSGCAPPIFVNQYHVIQIGDCSRDPQACQ
jgi:hypothetical protein